MGKAKNAVVEEEVVVDKKALKDAKKAAKKDVKQQLKALSLSHEPPAYVADSDCDALLRGFGLPLSKLAKLHVEWDGRVVNKAESFFSKTKAAHRFLQDEPTATWEGDEECTLIMVDVDAPEREGDGSVCGKRAPWLHWLVTGAKGSTAAGRTVTDYMAPSPAIGVHRLIFLLFKGTLSEKKIEERITWDVPAFMNMHPNLVPVAFNFMYVTSA